MNQQITFLTDGGEDIRDLPRFINPEAEHILDWFHIAMKLTVMGQTTKGLGVKSRRSEDDEEPETLDTARILKNLEQLKWYLWHGNVYQARKRIESLGWVWRTGKKTARRRNCGLPCVNSAVTLERIRARFPITATGIVMAKPSPHRLSNPPSIRSLAGEW